MENNFCKRVSLLTLGLLLTYISVFAQIHLQIFVKDSKQQAVERAEVSVQYGDSIVDFGITAKGVFFCYCAFGWHLQHTGILCGIHSCKYFEGGDARKQGCIGNDRTIHPT